MPEDDGRMICNNPTSYQLLKAKHGLKRATPHIKNFFSVLLEYPTNFVVGIGIILRFIFATAIFNVVRFVSCVVVSFLFMPTMVRKDRELVDAGRGNTLSVVCGCIGFVGNTLLLVLILGALGEFGVNKAPHDVRMWYVAFLALLTTNALSGISELGRYSRNKKSESMNAVSIVMPVSDSARASSDVVNVPAPNSSDTYRNLDNTNTVINCDTTPFVPDGFSVHLENQPNFRVRGMLQWDPKKVALYRDKNQQNGVIVGHQLLGRLAGLPVLPANVLDHLLANPHLIPVGWKDKYVFFWGTIYSGSYSKYIDHNNRLCVRYLYWDENRWRWRYYWLGYGFSSGMPTATLAAN